MDTSLRLFGHPHFTHEGNPIDIKTSKGFALVAYLSVDLDMISRDTAAALLWPEQDQLRARRNLRQVLHKLKLYPIGNWISSSNDLLKFEIPNKAVLDVQEFQILTDSMLVENKISSNSYRDLVAIYSGEFLAGFSIPDSATFEEWLILQREIYRSRMLHSLDAISIYSLENEIFDQAEIAAQHAVAIDTFRESSWQQLMIANTMSGNPGQALRIYQRYSQILNDDLSIEPTEEMNDLRDAIAEGKYVHPGLKNDQIILEEVIKVPQPVPNNIPVSTTPLIGRKVELLNLLDFLSDKNIRLLTITGEGGIGKSSLALEVSRKLIEIGKSDFKDGVYFVPLSPVTHSDMIVSTIAYQIGLVFEGSDSPNSLKTLTDYLANKKLLLLLDNFEQILSGINILVELLQTAPGVKLLVTSREPLRVHEEQIFPLTGLSVDENQSGQELFINSARRIQPGFNLDKKYQPAMNQILYLTQGIPLALEIAATWVDTLPVEAIASEIEFDLNLLETKIQDIPERHRSMRIVFDATWRGLDDEEKRVLAILSCLHGGFTRSASKNIAQTNLRLLSKLVGKSLLYYDSSGDRYQMHPLMQLFVNEILKNDEELYRIARKRHSDYFLDMLVSMRESLQAGWEDSALQTIDQEIYNIRQAWNWAIHSNALSHIGESAFMLHHYHLRRNLFEEGGRIFQKAICDDLTTLGDFSHQINARLRNFLGEFLWNSGKPVEARSRINQSISILDSLQKSNPDIFWDMAFSFYLQGQMNSDLNQKIRFHEESLKIFSSIPDAYRQATELAILGRAMHNNGQYSLAEEYVKDSLEIFNSLSNPYPLARTMGILGYQMFLQGKLSLAEENLSKSLDIAKDIEANDLVVIHINWLSQVLLLQGKTEKARELIMESLVEAQRSGFIHFVIHSTNISGLIDLVSGDYTEARSQHTLALTLAIKSGRRDFEGLSKMLLAAAVIAREDNSYALSLIDDSVEIFRQINRPDSLAEALVFSAIIYTHCGKIDLVCSMLREAWEILIDLHQYHIFLTGIAAAALYFAESGSNEKSITLYSLLLNHPMISESAWHQYMVGNHIPPIVGELIENLDREKIDLGDESTFWKIPTQLLAWLH